MKNSRRHPKATMAARLLAAGLALAALAALAAGCGLQRAGHRHGRHAGGAPRATGSPSAAAVPCLIRQLRIRLDVAAAGVAAGTSYLPVDFTNVSSSRCALDGFPQVTIAAGSKGRQIGAAATMDRSLATTAIVLAGRRTAHIWIHLADVANLPAASCKPVTAAGLRVSLPGQPQATFIGHRLTSCAKPVGGTDVLIVGPFEPGPARPGTAQ